MRVPDSRGWTNAGNIALPRMLGGTDPRHSLSGAGPSLTCVRLLGHGHSRKPPGWLVARPSIISVASPRHHARAGGQNLPRCAPKPHGRPFGHGPLGGGWSVVGSARARGHNCAHIACPRLGECIALNPGRVVRRRLQPHTVLVTPKNVTSLAYHVTGPRPQMRSGARYMGHTSTFNKPKLQGQGRSASPADSSTSSLFPITRDICARVIGSSGPNVPSSYPCTTSAVTNLSIASA